MTNPVHERENASTLSRHMSKVVAKSWLPEGKEIRQAILSNDSLKIKKVFEENGCDFSFYEGYGLEVDYDSFEGNLKEFKHTIVVSYPPRPSEFNLSDEDLRDWIEDKDSSISTPTHPYIPATF
jgi:hypothetical protein